MCSSLSLSLSIGEKRNRLEFERNSPPTKKRERRTRLLYTNVYENFGKKKANLKRVPFSLFFSLLLSLSKAERKNESTTTTRTTLTIYTSMGESDSFSSFFSFFLFFLQKSLELRTKTLAFLCVCLRRRRLCSFFF